MSDNDIEKIRKIIKYDNKRISPHPTCIISDQYNCNDNSIQVLLVNQHFGNGKERMLIS